MGCGGSTQGPAIKHERGIYNEFAEAIQLYDMPTERHRELVRKNDVVEFKHPRGQGEHSLLVLALDRGVTCGRWEWFR